jgi:catechol 2,3-dioxygenase-like lactoylglutathione lyase family enzyme
MDLTIQATFLNVSDLAQSVEFYSDVFDLRVESQTEGVAALMINKETRSQVLVLREIGRNAYHGGRGNIGPRLLSFEVGSLDELDVIEKRFAERQALASRYETETYRGIFCFDPDRIEVSVTSSLMAGPIRSEDWHHLGDMTYDIE